VKGLLSNVIVIIVALFAMPISIFAQSTKTSPASRKIDSIFDCSDVSIQFENDPTLTRAENLARMDAALLESLSKFDSCQQAKKFNQTVTNQPIGVEAEAGAASGAAGEGEDQGKDGISGTESANVPISTGTMDSVATSDMSGEERQQETESATAPQNQDSSGGASNSRQEVSGGDTEQSASSGSSTGKLPEDIPPADNDSVLEAQIRQAAINEKDPVIKAKLWNEYRKYKGLPPKK
jgi:hypothetical protein